MKIVLKGEKHHLRLYLPTSLIKSRIIFKLIMKKGKKFDNKTISDWYDCVKTLYKSIIKYKRKNGHFNLVDIETSDNKIIKIRI